MCSRRRPLGKRFKNGRCCCKPLLQTLNCAFQSCPFRTPMNSGFKRSELTTQARHGFETSPEPGELLFQLRNESPGLLVEDAFVVPHWFVQQTRWLEDPSNSDSAIYNYPLLFRIRGPLDEGALKQSLHEIVRRQ